MIVPVCSPDGHMQLGNHLVRFSLTIAMSDGLGSI
jgi:hypothetical protein